MPALTKVTTRAALNGNDFVNWGVDSSGAIVNEFSPLPSGYASQNNSVAVVVDSFGSFHRRSQGSGNSWDGNLEDGIAVSGDAVIVSTNARKFLRVIFGSAVKAVGFQAQTRFDLLDGRYKITLKAFDANGLALSGSHARSGKNSDAQAIFVGLSGANNQIKSIELKIENSSSQAVQFAINRLELLV